MTHNYLRKFRLANNLSKKEICDYLYLPKPENGCRKEGTVRLYSTMRRIIKIPPCLTTGWERFYMKKLETGCAILSFSARETIFVSKVFHYDSRLAFSSSSLFARSSSSERRSDCLESTDICTAACFGTTYSTSFS